MKYFFDVFDLPNEHKRWIGQERSYVDEMIDSKKKKILSKMEDEYLEKWGYWKDEIDRLSALRGVPNNREQIIKARFELTKYNEILKYCGLKNPRSMIKMKELSKI